VVRIASVLACLAVTASVAAAAPELPRAVAPPRTFDVAKHGAVGDGRTSDTAAIQSTIAACAAAGGGTVEVPAGTFLTGPLTLASNLDLHLNAGATLRLTDDPGPFHTGGRGVVSGVVADDCHDLSITGEGTIDGQGQRWWDAFRKVKGTPAAADPAAHRPYLVVLNRCERVLVRGVTLTDSPSFHLVPRACSDVTIDAVHFRAPADAPNTDGLDPSGWRFAITGCTFDVGDDCIAIKPSGAGRDGEPSCADFLVENCTFRHGHGLSIGGQTPGGLRHLVVRRCTFDGTTAGIRLKAGRGTGGVVEDLVYEDLTMRGVTTPIDITSYYPKLPADPAADPARPVTATTPVWRHITITRLTATGSPAAGRIVGLPEMPVDGVTLTDVHLSANKGLTVIAARGVRFVDSSVAIATGPTLIRGGVADVTGLADAGAR
jgi:polygalacturonase